MYSGLVLLAVVLGPSNDATRGERRAVAVSVAPASVADSTRAPVEDELPVEEEHAPQFETLEFEHPIQEPTEPIAEPAARPPPIDFDRFARLPSGSLGGPQREEPPVAEPLEEEPLVEEPPAAEPVEPPPVGLEPDGPAPALLEHPAPPYPALARQRLWEGSVLLRLELDAEGRVVSAVVESSSGHRVLDDSARNTVLRLWRFAPGSAGRVVRHRITFDLDGSK